MPCWPHPTSLDRQAVSRASCARQIRRYCLFLVPSAEKNPIRRGSSHARCPANMKQAVLWAALLAFGCAAPSSVRSPAAPTPTAIAPADEGPRSAPAIGVKTERPILLIARGDVALYYHFHG